jgi:hypothetical protein
MGWVTRSLELSTGISMEPLRQSNPALWLLGSPWMATALPFLTPTMTPQPVPQ